MKVVLLILILSGGFVSGNISRGDQDQGVMLDEDIKVMTLEDILSNNNNTDTDTSNFDIVDEKSIDEELNADDPAKDPVKTNWLIVVFCCFAAFILILLTVGVMFLYMKGNQVCTCFIVYVFYLSFLSVLVKGDKMKKSEKKKVLRK